MMILRMIVQVVIIGIWATVLALHTRRLLRMAHVEPPRALRDHHLRQQLSRVWWWLGREEFWASVQTDSIRCVQLTLMLFVLTLRL